MEKTESQIRQEIGTWEYLAGTLTQPHQQSIRDEILQTVKGLRYELSKMQGNNDAPCMIFFT